MIKIIGSSNNVLLDPDRYEIDSDPKIVENESYTGIIYKTIRKQRKRFTIGTVLEEEDMTALEALEAEGAVSFYDENNTEFTGFINALRFQRIAGTLFYNTSFNFRGWEA